MPCILLHARKSSQVILPSGFLVPLDWANASVVPASRAAVTTPITTRGKAIVISFAALEVRAHRPTTLVSGLSSAMYLDRNFVCSFPPFVKGGEGGFA